MPGLLPLRPGLPPVGAEQRIGVLNQLRQRLMRFGLAVQVFGNGRVAVDVVEFRSQRLGIRNRVVADNDARRLDQPRLDRVVQAEIRDDPVEQRGVGALLASRRERRGREVETALDAPGLVDAVEALDPARRFIQVDAMFFGMLLADLHLGRLAIGVVRLVVDDDDVLVRRQLAQHAPREGLVGFAPLLHHGSLRFLQRHQRVPVLDQHLRLVQLLAQGLGRAKVELVIVAALAGQQHLQPFLHGQARGHDEHSATEILVPLWIGQCVQHLPGDDHRHHRGLARPCGHLVAESLPRPAISGDRDALLVGLGPLDPPDQCLDRLELAEVERMLPRLAVVPVLQQLAGDDGHTGPAVRAPLIHARPDRVHQVQHLGALGVVARVEDLVARRPPLRLDLQLAALGLDPMLRRADEG